MKTKIKATSLILLAILIVSSTETTLKFMGTSSIGSFQLAFWRFLIGGAFLWLPSHFILRKKNQSLDKMDYLLFAFLGFLFIVVSMSFYQMAIDVSLASIVAILFSINPIFAFLFDYIFYHHKILRRTAWSIFLSLIGLIVIIFQYSHSSLLGLCLSLISSIAFGLYSSFSKEYSVKRKLSTLTVTGYSFFFGAIELLLILLLLHPLIAQMNGHMNMFFAFFNSPIFSGISWGNLPMLIYLSIVVTAAGFGIYFICQKLYPSISHVVFLAKPAVAPIISLIVLNERITVPTIIGIVIILLGSMLSFIKHREVGRALS